MIDNIDFKCPHCGQELSTTADEAGSALECPACFKPFHVPAAQKKQTAENKKPADIGSRFCRNCESVCVPTTHTKGSLIMELFLWFLFIIPGFWYTLWRLTTRERVCPVCLTPNMQPLSAPYAKRILAE
jgi:hypothetical protein